nr:hypothetical protein [Tanacetum cinerariifolium]
MDSIISLGQKNTLAEYMILSGADNRPPMLDKDLTKKYAELSAAEKIQADCDMKATNIILQDSGFAVPVFSHGDDLISCLNKAMAFLTTIDSSKFLSTNNQLKTSSNTRNQATIQDGKVTVQPVQGRQGQNYSGTTYKGNATSSKGNTTNGQARVVKCYNCQGEGRMARQCTQPKRQRNVAWYKEKTMLAEAQEARQILDEEQLAFLADPIIPAGQAQTIIPHNAAFQTGDLDTYDSDCDDLSNAQAVLMANISNYGSDVISELPNSETYLNDMDNQKTLILKQESRSKMSEKAKNPKVIAKNISYTPIDYEKLNRLTGDFGKRFTPQQELSAEQAFWLRISNPTIKSSLPPVRVEVPSELPKVSLVNESLRKLKFQLAQFDYVVKKRTTPNALTEEYFEKNGLKAQLKDKDTTIYTLKDTIKSLRKNNKEEIVDHDRCDLATINEELKNSVAKLLSENERLCKEINHVKQDLKAQIQDKVFVITSLKNDLRKLKGKATVDNAAQIPSATSVVPGMFQLDLEPLDPKLVHNRESHIFYLNHTQDQADILRGIVE